MNYIIKYVSIIILSNLILTTLIYIYLIGLEEGSQSLGYYEKFQIWWDNSKNLDSIIPSSSSKCILHPNIYTPNEIKRIFNYIDYKPCKLFTKDLISFDESRLVVNCITPKAKARYAVDINTEEIYGGSKKEIPKWSSITPNLEEKQFVFIKCSYSAVYAYVFNRFNQKASDSANEIRRKLGDNEKPMSVLLLVLDSVSRYSFQRNLPKTNSFLNNIQGHKEFGEVFSVFEFEKSATPKAFTKYNMAQIYYGKSVEEIEDVVGSDISLLEQNKEIYLEYQENAIWRFFSSLGT